MLYYTGAKTAEDIQDNPLLSLGGYKSSTQIPNGKLHNVFPKITQGNVIKNTQIVRLIVFQNLTGADLTDLTIYNVDGDFSTLQMAFVSPAIDSCGNPQFERIQENNLPYQGTFASYDIDNKYASPTIPALGYIGIWLKKNLKLDQFGELEKGVDVSCEGIEQALLDVSYIGEEKVDIIFTWGV